MHVHTCVHACRVPNFIIFLLLSSYFGFLHFDFPCFTFECELPGGGVLLCFKLLRISICFYLTCGCEDHAWPMGSYTVPRGCGVLSASEICLAFFSFFFFSSFHMLLFVCGPTVPTIFNRNTLSSLCCSLLSSLCIRNLRSKKC